MKNLLEKLTLVQKWFNYQYHATLSKLKYSGVIFLDTNLVIAKPKETDYPKRISLFPGKYMVTDVIDAEIKAKIASGFKQVFNRPLKIVSFSDIREEHPDLCPVYYNIVTLMYNPANIASPEFLLHMLQSLKLRRRPMTNAQDQLYKRLMNRLKDSSVAKTNMVGRPKDLLSQHMDIGYFKYFQKRVKEWNSPNLLNDYKNIATALLFALTRKTNITILTADRDIVPALCTLMEGLCQSLAFNSMFLPTLSNDDKTLLFQDKTITRFIDFDKFQKVYSGLLSELIDPWWKKDFISIKVRIWDKKKHIFTKSFHINLDPMLREMVLYTHGPLSCPFGKNDTHGNWLHYLYWPPDPKTPKIFKMIGSVKKVKSRKNIYVDDTTHSKNCKYAIDDRGNRLREYFGFRL